MITSSKSRPRTIASQEAARRTGTQFSTARPAGGFRIQNLRQLVKHAVRTASEYFPEILVPEFHVPYNDFIRDMIMDVINLGTRREKVQARALLRELARVTPRWKQKRPLTVEEAHARYKRYMKRLRNKHPKYVPR